MEGALYLRLALRSLKKNYRTALPLFGGSAILVALLYSVFALPHSLSMHLQTDATFFTLYFESIVGLFQFFILIFYIYLNSTWNRARARENALLTFLGMEKGQLIRITFYQLALFYLSSLVTGTLMGICVEKILLMFLLKLLHLSPLFGFFFCFEAWRRTASFIFKCYLVMFILSIIFALRSKPLEQLHHTQMGEKPLRAPLFFASIGLAALIGGYSLAILTKTPSELIVNFIFAVILVIMGTYLLFLYGSSILLDLLSRNKNAYYRTRNFISWSTIKLQLRKNALALANMSILSTMLLLTSATTISLELSIGQTVRLTYPSAYQVTLLPDWYLEDEETTTSETRTTAELTEAINEAASDQNIEFKNLRILHYSTQPIFNDVISSFSSVADLEDLNAALGSDFKLRENEILDFGSQFEELDEIKIGDQPYQIIHHDPQEKVDWYQHATPFTALALDLNNLEPSSEDRILLSFDLVTTTQQPLSAPEVEQVLLDFFSALYPDDQVFVHSRSSYAESLDYTYSVVLITGLYVTIIFLLAVILILYFKQITQGQEDRERFKIMKQIGLEPREIRRIINSQVRIMFFSPLLTALAHILFAFPMIQLILNALAEYRFTHFFAVLACCFMSFALIYWIIFRLTARTYYKLAMLNDSSNPINR